MPPSPSSSAHTYSPSSALVAAMLASFLFTQSPRPFSIDLLRALPATLILGALTVALFIGRRTNRPRLEAGAAAFLLMTSFTLLGVVLAYAFAAHAGPLWDVRLAMMDRRIGFYWPFLLAALDRHPILIWLLGLAYHSLTLQMIVVIVALSGAARFDVLRIMVCAAILSGFVTILISAWVPAMGNLFDPAGYRHLWPSIAWLERDLIQGLRDGSVRVLDLTMLMGIVSFPSFHATLAAIFIWTLKAVPRLTWAGRIWAVLTILATPVFGGHYGVDVIMGLLLAPPAILIARSITRRTSQPGVATPLAAA